MLHASRYLPALLLIPILPAEALALGADHGKEQLAAQGPNCVHGYFVNQVDFFFFAGDAAACADFVATRVKAKGGRVRVVLHPGTTKARSPWDKADRDLGVDWALTTGDGRERVAGDDRDVARVDVWVGGRVKLGDLKLPAEVEVASGGEIERFITEHHKQNK